ncbi:MAG: glycosyltransferase [Erysipelotrichaceae bacterium]|nr:glycosyltransferase [Erysipelotrichaceae bacterium]
MNKVTILSLHLAFGGIEKAICSLANLLVDDYEVEIISEYKLLEKPAFPLDERVKVKYLIPELKPNGKEFKEALKAFNIASIIKEGIISAKVLYLKKHRMIEAIKYCDADVIISSRLYFNNLLGKYGKPETKKVGWEHNHWEVVKGQHDKVVKSAENLDVLVSCSKQINEHYSNYVNCRCVAIGNIIDFIPDEYPTLEEKNMIAVGSLIERKGFLDLIDIMNQLCKKDDRWHLNLFGDGEQKPDILNKIKEYGLENNVTVHGFQSKDVINSYLSKSSIYMMTSHSEALPIVLLEAVSFGLPIVAYECPGVDEIVEEDLNGYRISGRDIEDYCNKTLKLISDSELRKQFGKHAFEVSHRYSKETIKTEWENLIESL